MKIAIVGQAGSGKCRILSHLANTHGQAAVRTTVVSNVEVSRTEYIVSDPLEDGSFVRVRVFAISGIPSHQAAEQLVLSGCDGLVFVADCDPRYISDSRECLLNVLTNAHAVGLDLTKISVAVQYHRAERYPNFNPQDLDGWLGIEQGKVARYITTSDGDHGSDAAVNGVVEKAVANLAEKAEV